MYSTYSAYLGQKSAACGALSLNLWLLICPCSCGSNDSKSCFKKQSVIVIR